MGIPSQSDGNDPDATGLEDEFDLSTPATEHSEGVGTLLRQARERFGEDLRQTAVALRIRATHLQAIEDENYDELPARAYAIGFIRAYAHYLGLDGSEMVRRFKEETEGQGLKPDLSLPMPLSDWSVPSSTILLGGVIIALCGYGLWYYASSDDQGRTERVAAVPAALLPPPAESRTSPAVATGEVAASPVQYGASPSAPIGTRSESPAPRTGELAPAQPEARPTPPHDATAPGASATSSLPALEPAAGPSVDQEHVFGVTDAARYRIALRATNDTWLEVKDGKTVIFRRLMQAGDEYRLPDRPGLTMRIGNSKGIEVTIDGKPLPGPAAADLLRHVVANLDAQELLARAGTQ